MTENALTIPEQDLPTTTNLDRPMTTRELLQQGQLIHDVLTKVMVGPTPDRPQGIHYGIVPGTEKPTLLQPGAEKICALFRLAPKARVEDLSEPDHNYYRFRVHVSLHTIRDGLFVGEAIGSASSLEEKHQWRRAICQQEWDETPSDERRKKYREAKNEAGFETVLQVRRPAADLENTVLKIAYKRALISVTRGSTAASDLLDVDMDEEVNQDLRRDQQQEQPKPKPKKAAAPLITYGQYKGKTIDDASVPLSELEYWVKSKKERIASGKTPEKFRGADQAWIAAAEEEIARRKSMADMTASARPKDTRPPMTDDAWHAFIYEAESQWRNSFEKTLDEFGVKSETVILAEDRWLFYDAVNARVASNQ